MEAHHRRWLIAAAAAVVLVIAAFVLFGGPGDPADDLANGAGEVRIEAIHRLSERNDAQSAQVLSRYVRDQDTQVATQSLLALSRMKSQGDSGSLAQALRDNRPEVREAAIVALAPRDPGAVRQVLTDPREKDQVRATAVAELGAQQNWESMPDMIKAMNDPSEEVRKAAYNSVLTILGVRRYAGYDPEGDDPKSKQERAAFVSYLLTNYGNMKDSVDDWKKRVKMKRGG